MARMVSVIGAKPNVTRSPATGTGAVTPTREEFHQLAAERRVIPVVRRVLADAETPIGVYRKLAGGRPGTFLFESAENGQSWSRWPSLAGAGPPPSPPAAARRPGTATPPSGRPSGGHP